MGVFYKYKKLVFTFFIIVSFSGFSQTTISGKVFEDINYGGGVGRSYNDANTSASALSGFSSGDIGTGTATVQLWNSNGTSLISSQPTNTLGNYSFTVSTNTTYRIRVVKDHC